MSDEEVTVPVELRVGTVAATVAEITVPVLATTPDWAGKLSGVLREIADEFDSQAEPERVEPSSHGHVS